MILLDSPRNIKITSSGVFTFRYKKNGCIEVLLLHNGQFWDFPKGIVEKGESLKQCAQRELFEETNLDLAIISKDPLVYLSYEYQVPKKTITKGLSFFGGIVHAHRRVLLSYEHEDYEWMDPAKAIYTISFDANRNGLRRGILWALSKRTKAFYNKLVSNRILA